MYSVFRFYVKKSQNIKLWLSLMHCIQSIFAEYNKQQRELYSASVAQTILFVSGVSSLSLMDDIHYS